MINKAFHTRCGNIACKTLWLWIALINKLLYLCQYGFDILLECGYISRDGLPYQRHIQLPVTMRRDVSYADDLQPFYVVVAARKRFAQVMGAFANHDQRHANRMLQNCIGKKTILVDVSAGLLYERAFFADAL